MTRARLLLAVAYVSLIVFVGLAVEAREQEFFAIDRTSRLFVQAGHGPILDRVMHGLSDLGSGYVLIPLSLAIWALLWWRRQPRPWLLPVLAAGATLVEGLTKWIVHRPRPKGAAYGFPSGHVTVSVVLFGALVYLLWTALASSKARWTWSGLCVGAVLGIGYSRLYLNAHWLSDVLGGLAVGIAYLAVSIAWIERSGRSRGSINAEPRSMLTPLLYRAYERRLLAAIRQHPLPRHLGLIQDGHRRYARDSGLSNPAGYALGAAKAEEVLTWCAELGIPMVTLWWLSTENLSRHPDEIGAVLDVIENTMGHWIASGWAERLGIRIRPIGKLDLLPRSALEALEHAASATRHHDRLLLNAGVGYGGRQEIVDAVKRYLHERFELRHAPEQIVDDLTPDAVAKYLYTYDCPDPDLIIRTSGEVRLSGFMLWQSAYSEYYFCDVYWPAFRKLDFLRAIRSYQQRHRRFGK